MPVFVPAAELDKAKREAQEAKQKKPMSVKPKKLRPSSIGANTPDSSTLTTPGMRRRGMSLAYSKCGAMTSSPICVATSKKPPLSTS